jgi:hypothetical protein
MIKLITKNKTKKLSLNKKAIASLALDRQKARLFVGGASDGCYLSSVVPGINECTTIGTIITTSK